MIHRHLRNLSSSELVPGLAPWEFTDFKNVPEECLIDKAARDAWINLPATEHHVYSGFEGLNPNRRLRAAGKATDDDNPPRELHYIAIDADIPTTPEEAVATTAKMGEVKPAWFEHTLSGNGRFIFMLEKPVRFLNRATAVKFMQAIGELIPVNMIAGVDYPALHAIERYFTNSGRWTKLSEYVVPHDRAVGLMAKLLAKERFDSKEYGKVLSLDRVREELVKRYPRFAEWSGDFALEAQGPTFWVEGSTSPKSAIIKETGILTFSAHATKMFYSWAELVGSEFVEAEDLEKIGRAVKDVFYDERNYFRPGPDGSWFMETERTLRLYLVGKGLRTKAAKGENGNEIDRAFNFIHEHQRVSGVASFAFYPKGHFYHEGRRYLNQHTRDAMAPADELTPWGPTGKFPNISAFLDQFFMPVEGIQQLQYLLTLWQQVWTGFRNRKPIPGPSMLIAGGVGVGKTALAQGLIARSLGGFTDPGAFLTGNTQFNSELFEVGCWCIDDLAYLSTESMHRFYSNRLKQSVANPTQKCNEKFRKPSMVRWSGLIIITCNDDPHSLQQVPDMDISNRDKMHLFRANPNPTYVFKSLHQQEEIFDRELPYFLRWLVDYVPPVEIVGTAQARFGMHTYAEPSLLRAVNQSSGSNAFGELVFEFLKGYFTDNPGAEFWEGTATKLRMDMTPFLGELLRSYRPEGFIKNLRSLQARGMYNMTNTDESENCVWKIHREGRFDPPKPAAPVAQSPNSKFEKP